MVRDRTRKLEEEVADLKARWPAHSVKPSMWQRLEETEEELEKGRGEASDGVESTSTASVASWPWKGLQVSLRSARNMARSISPVASRSDVRAEYVWPPGPVGATSSDRNTPAKCRWQTVRSAGPAAIACVRARLTQSGWPLSEQ